MTDAATALSRPTRWFIVLMALTQGLLMYLAHRGAFGPGGSTIFGYTVALAVPTAMILSVRRLNDARFWQQAAGMAAVCALLALWAGWSATGAPDLRTGTVLAPFGVTLAIGLFIALPYLQCRLDHGRWHAPYSDLFEHGWQNALTLALTAAFVGLCWAVLGLCAALFKLIGIEFFAELFQRSSFVHLATGVMVGLGVLVGRTQQRPVQIARQILFAVFKGLLPLIALIALLFVVSLPFTGLDALWRTRSATLILMSLIAVMVLFVNAVYQDGSGEPPYPRWLRRVVEAALLSLPLYAALGGYALALRIGQYGWTAERFWAVVASVLLSAYALGYAWAALRPRRGWLRPLMQVNIAVSLAAVVVAVAANSLLLDPHRLTVGDQLARLRDGHTAPEAFDLEHLRFQSGRRGYEALQGLKSNPKFAAPAQRQRLEQALAATSPWQYRTVERRAPQRTLAEVSARIRPAPGTPAPDPAWLQSVLRGDLDTPGCLDQDAQCVLMATDLDRDGRVDYLLCHPREHSAQCQLYSLEDGVWVRVAEGFASSRQSRGRAEAIRAGQVQAVPQRWPDLRFGADDEPIRLQTVPPSAIDLPPLIRTT